MDEISSGGGKSTSLTVATSREVAVARLARGTTVIYAGAAGLLGAVLADIAGIGGVVAPAAQFGGALLIWVGCVTMATGVPHLVRFGTRRGAAALLSLAGAGVAGLVAVAEMFESLFLDSSVLAGLDEWALLTAVVLVVVSGVLLNRGRDAPESDDG